MTSLTTSFLIAILELVNMTIQLYIFIIIGRALISWVNPDPRSAIVQFLIRATEPVLRPLRAQLPDMGGIDISPIIVILILGFIRTLLNNLFAQMMI